MFQIDPMVDFSIYAAKQFSQFIPSAELRKQTDSIIDLQSYYTKKMFNTSIAMSETITKQK